MSGNYQKPSTPLVTSESLRCTKSRDTSDWHKTICVSIKIILLKRINILPDTGCLEMDVVPSIEAHKRGLLRVVSISQEGCYITLVELAKKFSTQTHDSTMPIPKNYRKDNGHRYYVRPRNRGRDDCNWLLRVYGCRKEGSDIPSPSQGRLGIPVRGFGTVAPVRRNSGIFKDP